MCEAVKSILSLMALIFLPKLVLLYTRNNELDEIDRAKQLQWKAGVQITRAYHDAFPVKRFFFRS